MLKGVGMQITDFIPGSAILRFVKALVGLAVVYLLLRASGFHRLLANDTEGIGVLLQVVGTLYSVLYAFATYVVCGQFTAVESEIFKESAALQDLVLFSGRWKAPAREPILQAGRVYARAVADTEWKALAQCDPTEKTDRLFAEIVSAVTEVKAEDEDQRTIYGRLLDIADQACVHRGERLSLSVKRIPRTLMALVTLTAATIVFLLFLYAFRSTLLGLVSLAVTTMLLWLTYFVITDLDNPFTGTWNVVSTPFEQLLKKAR